MRRILNALAFLLSLFLNISGQDNNYPFRKYNMENGLPSGIVYNTCQDENGFMWIATFGGIVRFNGISFDRLIIDSSLHKVIQKRDVKTVFCDSHNNVWIGNNGLNLFNASSKTFVTYCHNSADSNSLGNDLVKKIIEDRSGNLWIGHYDGVSLFNRETKKFKNYKIIGSFIHSLCEDNEGNIWIGSFSQGLYKLNPTSNKIINYQYIKGKTDCIGSNNVKDILLDQNGDLWFATWGGGLNLYNKKNENFLRFIQNDSEREFNANNVNALLIDKQNQFWIGTDNGIYIFNKKKYVFHPFNINETSNTPKSENVISYIAEDCQGNIWFSGGKGLRYYNQAINNFRFFQNENLFRQNKNIHHIYSLSNNIYYLSYQNGYLEWNTIDNSVQDYLGEKIIFHDNKKRFWKLSNSYLTITLPDNIQSVYQKYYPTSSKGGLLSNKIINISNDSFGNYWIQYDSLLNYSILNPEKKIIEHFSFDNINLIKDDKWSASALFVDKTNNVWTSYWNVLFKYNLTTKQNTSYHSLKNGLSSPTYIKCIADKNNKVWFATLTGLDMYNPETDSFQTFNTDKGLPDNNILDIIPDKDDNLWVLTSLGIAYFNTTSNKITKYDIKNGLPLNQFTSGVLTPEGDIALYAEKGMAIFNPALLKRNEFIPPVFFFRLLLNNEEVKVNASSILPCDVSMVEEIKLKYNQTNVTFECVSLNFINPERNNYAYCLKQKGNSDCNWINLGTNNKVSFNNLEPGNYILTVIASNNDGVWNTKGATLKIKVLPPFWKTWWFNLLMLIILIALIVAIFISREIILKKQKNELEQLVKKRTLELTKQAEELKLLNTTKDKLFAIIGHDLKNPFQAIMGLTSQLNDNTNNDIQQNKNTINAISATVKNASEILENLLAWAGTQSRLLNVSIEAINLYQLVSDNINFYKLVAQKKNINLILSVSNQIYINADKNMLSTTIRNLIGNAIKFTLPNGEVKILATVINNMCTLSVEDNGIGMDSQQIEKLFLVNETITTVGTTGEKGTGLGLFICKEFVEKNKCKLSIKSEVGKGSIFSFTLPAEIKYIADTNEMNFLTENSELDIEEEKQNIAFLKSIKKEDRLILVVEDNKDIRLNILSLLNKYFRTDYAADGKQGLNKAFDLIPDLIISDVMMPEMDGYELCKLLKTDIRTSHIPLILLTARTEEKSQLTGIIYGADDYLTKPFQPKVLIARIKNLIEQRNLLREKFSKDFILQPAEVPISEHEAEFLSLTLKVVEQNIDKFDFSVEQFSEQMGLSYMQLYRKMESITGQTPLIFIRSIRLKRAAQLIERTDLNITEIAILTGFNDPSHFSKSFKEFFKIPPKQYLLQKRKK